MFPFRSLLLLVAFMAVAYRTGFASKIEADTENAEVMQAVISAAGNDGPFNTRWCTVSTHRFGVGCYIKLNVCESAASVLGWIAGACLYDGRRIGPCGTSAYHQRSEDAVKDAKESLVKKLAKGQCGFNTTHTVAETE